MEHEIIKTEQYLLVVDENLEISKSCYCLDALTGKIVHTSRLVPLTSIEFKDRGVVKIASHLPLNNAPILEGVDLLPELEVKDYSVEAAKKFCKERSKLFNTMDENIAWREGYNFKAATKTYSEEDLRKAYKMGKDYTDLMLSEGCDWKPNNPNALDEDEFIKSLNEPAIPVGFKATMVRLNKLGKDNTLVFEEKKIKTVLNEKGIPVWQGEYIFK